MNGEIYSLYIEAIILELNILQIISLICIGSVVLVAFGFGAVSAFRLFLPILKKLMRRMGNFIGITSPGIEPEVVFLSFEEQIRKAGFEYNKESDFFYSNLYPWQRRYGYARLYDVVAPVLSMIIDSEPIRFEYAGRRWLIEVWKGQYGMTTGCEVGVYSSEIPTLFLSKIVADNDPDIDDEERWDRLMGLATDSVKDEKKDKDGAFQISDYIDYDEILGYKTDFYHSIDDDELMFMTFIARKNGKILLANRGEHWWLTGFKLGEFSNPSEIQMSVSITLKDSEMRDAFLNAMYKIGYKPSEINVRNNTVHFTFDRPKSKQPYTRSLITDKLTQSRNKALCQMYQELTKGAVEMPDKLQLLYKKNPLLYNQALQFGKSKSLFTGFKE